MIRKEENQWLQRYGRLYQQYVVDMYAKIESQRLFYLRSNQKKLRTDIYQGIQDAVVNGNYFIIYAQLILIISLY